MNRSVGAPAPLAYARIAADSISLAVLTRTADFGNKRVIEQDASRYEISRRPNWSILNFRAIAMSGY